MTDNKFRSNLLRFSIILPVYNVENYLAACLQSIANQTERNFECIAINDGSTDNSGTILKEYLTVLPQMRIIDQENRGLGGARNTGIKSANAEYLIFLDSDDTLSPLTIEELNKCIEGSYPDIISIGCNRVKENGEIIQTIKPRRQSIESAMLNILGAKEISAACTKVVKKKIFIDNNITYPENTYHEDLAVTYKLFNFVQSSAVIYRPLYQWLQRAGSISKSINSKYITDFYYTFDDTLRFLEDNGLHDKAFPSANRRYFHFLTSLISRMLESDLDDDQKRQYFDTLFRKINEWDWSRKYDVRKLAEHRPELYAKHFRLCEKLNTTPYTNDLVKVYLKSLDSPVDIRKQLARLGGNSSSSITKKTMDIVLKLYYGIPALQFVLDTIFPINSKQRNYLLRIYRGEAKTYKPSRITKKERNKLLALKDRFRGERCFIIGNGPSLNKCDLKKLENEYSFGVNGIFYKTDEMGFKPTFYVVEDTHVVDDNLDRINEFDCEYKFFPALFRKKIKAGKNTYFLPEDIGFYRGDHPSYCIPRFSYDVDRIIYTGQSVTYLNMQLAYFLGFTEVYLIGMDFSYSVPKATKIQGSTFISNEDDPNHFHPEYFGRGKKWHDPKVDRVAWNYMKAKEEFEKDNRKIYNATVGGALEIFERKDYASLFTTIADPNADSEKSEYDCSNKMSVVAAKMKLSSDRLSSSAYMKRSLSFTVLRDRLIHFYTLRPVLVAVVAVVLNAIAMAGVPFSWAFMAAGNALLLLLIGHAATRSQATAVVAQNAANRAAKAAGSAVERADKAMETAGNAVERADKAMETAGAARAQHTQLVQKANSLNVSLFQGFSRQLSDQDIDRLIRFWGPTLGLELKRNTLGYLAHRVCLVEDTCSGRLATTVQDALLRILLAQSIPGEHLSILEIGTLFGVNLAVLHETCRGRFPNIQLTAIDPLEGYYDKSVDDILTGIPVSREIFEHNMRRMDVPKTNVTLIQALSTTKSALKKASARKYHSLIIDGDHSYEGVKFDFEHYCQLVEPGGYIVFDDYGTAQWPEVGAYVDQEVRSHLGVELIGVEWRTAVFRVVQPGRDGC